MNSGDIKKLAKKRDELIASLNLRFESSVQEAQRGLLKHFVSNFIDMLQIDENGNIAPTSYNKNLLLSVDKLFTDFGKKHNVAILASLINGVGAVLNYNQSYYSNFQGNAELLPLKQKAIEQVQGWLGIDGDQTKANGYLDTLIKSDTVKNQLKDLSMRAVYSQNGWNATKQAVQDFIEGKDDKSLGALQKYYRNYTYDLISQVDRATAKTYADSLKFEFAIYEGGLIETSRPFCEEHNGNVYHISEIMKFDPPTAKQPNYNPFTDLGGYACRHHLNWIPTALALAMRPDAKKLVGTGLTGLDAPKQDAKPKEEQKAVEKKVEPTPLKEPTPIKPSFDPNKNFDEIADLKITPFKAPQDFKSKEAKEVLKVEGERQDLSASLSAKIKEVNSNIDKLNKMTRRGLGKSDEYKKLNEIVDKQLKESKTIKKDLVAKTKAIELDGEKFFKELIAAKKTASNIKLNNLSANKHVDETFAHFQKISAGYNDGLDIKVKNYSGRAYYSPKENTAYIAKGDNKYVVMHELGHSLEKNNYVMKAAVDFLKKRVGGLDAEKFELFKSGSGEFYQKGGFYNDYVGKVYRSLNKNLYGGRYATEVISMGLEQMYRNPRLFYQQDKEHFELIYNLFFKKWLQ